MTQQIDLEGRSVSQGALNGESLRAARQHNLFRVPKSAVGYSGGILAIGVVALTADEEAMAATRCGTSPIRLAAEQAKECLRRVATAGAPDKDGKPSLVWRELSTADGSADRVWNQIDPKMRSLVIQAFSEVHRPKDGDVEDFLASREVTTG